jgi:hypothetical protein
LRLIPNQEYWFLYVLLLAGAVGVSYFAYRRTPPTISRRLRNLLLVLRCVSFTLVLLALLEPVLAISRTMVVRPTVAILVDSSESMAVGESNGRILFEDAIETAERRIIPALSSRHEVRTFSFSSGVSELARDEVPAGRSTNLSSALLVTQSLLAESNLGAVVVLSDGCHNQGQDPIQTASELPVPVFTVGFGSTAAPRDVSVASVVTNKISYTGDRLPINVGIESSNFNGGEVEVTLAEGDRVLGSRVVPLHETKALEEVTFFVDLEEPGLRDFRVSVPVAEGEASIENNSRTAATKVLKSRIKVLCLGGRPSWDFAFIRRALEDDANVDVISFAETNAGRRKPPGFPGSIEALREFDLVVMVEMPVTGLGNLVSPIAELVSGGELGLVTIGDIEGRLPAEWKEILPALPGSQRLPENQDYELEITPDGVQDPVMRLRPEAESSRRIWMRLPPVTGTGRAFAAKPEATVLAEMANPANPDRAFPVIISSSESGIGVICIAAGSIWRWDLMMAGTGSGGHFNRLWSNIVRWIISRGEASRVAVSTDRFVYRSGETVAFTGQVYDLDFRLTTAARLTVAVIKTEGDRVVGEIQLTPGRERFTGSMIGLSPGQYTYSAVASIGEEALGTSEGRFTVDTFSLEGEGTYQDVELLRGMASASGGKYISPEEANQIPSYLELQPEEVAVRREIELWNNPVVFLLVLGFVAAEWWIRRQRGLA